MQTFEVHRAFDSVEPWDLDDLVFYTNAGDLDFAIATSSFSHPPATK